MRGRNVCCCFSVPMAWSQHQCNGIFLAQVVQRERERERERARARERERERERIFFVKAVIIRDEKERDMKGERD